MLPASDKAQIIQCLQVARANGYALTDACRFYEAHNPSKSLTLEELVDNFLEAKRRKNLKEESLRLLETTMQQFMDGRYDTPAALISQSDVESFINNAEWSNWRRRGAIIDLGNLFNWAVKKHLLAINPVSAIDRPIIDHKTPEILTTDEVMTLLKLCREFYPSLVAGISIALFAGLRSSEIRKLQWSDLKISFIELKSHITKGRARRLVTIRPTLEAWLATCRKATGPVWPVGSYKQVKDFRRQASGLPRNVLRHSFISYALGAGEAIDKVAMESGNTPEICFTHYRELVTPSEASEFWALTPEAVGK